jgi:hypothetical protein
MSIDTQQLLTGLAGVVVGGVLTWLWRWGVESLKPILFASEHFRVEYPLPSNAFGEVTYTDTPVECGDLPAICRVDVRFFNKKSKPIGLHRLAIVFTTGGFGCRKWFCKKRLTLDDLRESDASMVGPFPISPQLDVLTLAADDWTVVHILASSRKFQSIAAGTTVWLTAETTEGKKRRWPLATVQ